MAKVGHYALDFRPMSTDMKVPLAQIFLITLMVYKIHIPE